MIVNRPVYKKLAPEVEKQQLTTHSGGSVNIAKMSQPQATAVVLEGIVVPNNKGKSWAGLNAARQEGQWDRTRSSGSGENVMPVANGLVVDVFDYTKLLEAPTNVPRPGAYNNNY